MSGDINSHSYVNFQYFLMINADMESSHQEKTTDITYYGFFFKNKKYLEPKLTVGTKKFKFSKIEHASIEEGLLIFKFQ